jgi:hypothetical protein
LRVVASVVAPTTSFSSAVEEFVALFCPTTGNGNNAVIATPRSRPRSRRRRRRRRDPFILVVVVILVDPIVVFLCK